MWLEPRAPRRLRPAARGARPHLAVPLRVPQPRLRRLPRLLRALPAGLPRHLRPDDREDGLGDRRPSSGVRTTSCKRLAALALELGVADLVKAADGEDELRAALAGTEAGERWLADFEETKDPWFYFSYGTGAFYHHHRSWIDDPTLPIATIGSYIERLEAGEDIARPREAVARRARADHRRSTARSLPTEPAAGLRRAVSRSRARSSPTSRTTTSTSTTGTSRSSGTRCASSARSSPGTDSSASGEDVFYLRHDEVRSALEELRLFWSSGGVGLARGPRTGRRSSQRRKAIHDAMREWAPPPALGQVPEAITEPLTIMLWGITTERVQEWLVLGRRRRTRRSPDSPASPGDSRGPGARRSCTPTSSARSRRARSSSRRRPRRAGRRCSARSPRRSLDVGGIMCHAAIVAREYGLPAVVGTGSGDEADQDRRPAARRCRRWRGNDPQPPLT